ncbi:Cytochrome c oxidase subunit 6B-like protein new16 [Golovinomyces cichoracearum]|uniref:Cytochrome c oxidase subunit 6B-like protein new16 n=1 Tax=Golovinomyces cichoracearum TaxID=62708 RepID=A0A420HF85_9PEZI|nr:Cytochrome c oxidase subunit 6B-like protein new16 [Golovinomyces cichoracearum]
MAPTFFTTSTSTATATIAPDRSKREKCWLARDNFFSCLDKHNIVDSIREKNKVDKVCRNENTSFEADCISSWVTYFKQRRVAEWKKSQAIEKLEAEGAVRLEGQLPPPPVKR